MLNFKMTEHASMERLERIAQINMTVGFGEIIRWDWQEQKDEYYCLTSTGVFAVVASDKQTLITAWIASFAQGVKFYKSVFEMPPFMRTKLRKNEKYRALMEE